MPDVPPSSSLGPELPYETRHLQNVSAALRQFEHPSRIGPYLIEGILGEGGMGVVYRARQIEPIARTVALKVIKIGLDTREVIRRFEIERQTLAMMDHPNIARVLDAGVAESGKPYFVMEYVEGESLTRYADAHQLTVRQRLELFLQACAAVQHAHQKAIIHRDIKPSNILVTEREGRPTVRVIDFGVATAMRKELTQRTTFIDHGQLLGTPEYMAPEQTQAPYPDVDTRTDVYSLGVVLYELLSGALPFDAKTLRSAGYNEIGRIIREVEPPAPSTRLSGLGVDGREIARRRQTVLPALERELRSELEWIPLKAMHKERNERYATATELAADLENYLANRPLHAGPISRRYRIRKFARRNKTGVAVGAAMLLLILGGVSATTWQAIRATRAERLSREDAERAHLAEGAARNEAKRASEAEAQARGEADRANKAEAQALADAKRASEAEARSEGERKATSQVNEFLIEMFQSVDPRLAKGKPVLVADILDKAAEGVETKFKDQPEVEAAVRAAIGTAYHGIAQYEKAETHASRALELYRQLHGPDDDKSLDILELQGLILHRRGKFKESLSIAEEAYERRKRVAGASSGPALNALNNLAVMQQLLGDYASAEKAFGDVWKGYLALYGEDGSKTLDAERKVAQMQISLAKYDEAERMLRDVGERLRRVNGENDTSSLNNITELARVLHYTKKFDEAERLAREGFERSKVVFGEDHSHTLTAQYALAIALSDLQRPEAIDLYLATVEKSKKVSGPNNPATLSVMNGTSIELFRLGRNDEAIALNREALAGLTQTLGPDAPQRISALNNLCRKLQGLGRWQESLPLAQELYDRLGDGGKVQYDAARKARSRALLGLAFSNLGKHPEAEPLLIASEQALSEGSGNEEILSAVLDALIATETALNKPADAETYRARRQKLAATSQPAK